MEYKLQVMKTPSYQINISSPAYLRVELPDGTRVYTLNRLFNISDAGRLITAEGYSLFEYVDLKPPYTNLISVSSTGDVSELISSVWTHIGNIEAVIFEHPEQLQDLGNGYFSETIGSGVSLIGNPGGAPPFDTIQTSSSVIFNAQKFYPHVVMLVKPDACNDVLSLARTVISSMTDNASIFISPDPPLSTIEARADILQNLITEVENGNHMKKELRDEASISLYNLLQDETIYVNEVGDGDRGILELSGFSVIDPPNPKPVPGQIIIKRIDDGPYPNSAKIFIENPGQTSLIYEVQSTQTPDDESSWKKEITTVNSHELIITNRVFGQLLWYRVNASNSSGSGPWSIPYRFISRQ